MKTRNFIHGAVGGLVMSLAISTSAPAEELRILTPDPVSRVLLFWGDVEQGSSARLEQMLTLNPDIEYIYMISAGGNAFEGYRIADVLSRHSIKAIVPEGFACLSACAVGFIGAAEYYVEGLLGFHNVYIPEGEIETVPPLNLLLAGQGFGTHTTVFFIANGFEVELPILIGNHTSPEVFVVFTNTEDLMEFFARSDTDKIEEYLEPNGIDQDWVDTHVWGTQEFREYFGGGQ